MIRSLRAFFLARLLREKLLLIALALGIAVVWCSSASGRVSRFWSEARETTSTLKTQSLWLTERGAIEKAAAAAAAQLNSADTLDATRLVAAISGLATDAGIAGFTTGEPTEENNSQFAIHTVPFSVNKITWESLMPFYINLQHKAPYMTIESMAIVGERGDPRMLDVTIKISSVEVIHAGS